MKINKIYFSPTGHTKEIIDYVAEYLSDEINYIDLSAPECDFSKYVFDSDDICIFAVPSFGGRVPDIAVRRLNELQGNGNLSIIIATYGNRHYDDTLLELKNTVMGRGFEPFAAIACVCQHSIMKDIAKNRPDKFDFEELKEFSEIIKRHIDKNELEIVDVPGNMPYKDFSGVPFKPFSNDKCIFCKKCANKCPVQAIPFNSPDKTFNEICISCMRCVEICPVKARSLGEENLKIITEKFAPMCKVRKENELFI